MRPYDIKQRTFLFAIEVIKLSRNMQTEAKEFFLSKQVMRSGTAIGALVREAQNAESDKDFIHKMAIAQKECDETIYWLELISESNLSSKDKTSVLIIEANELLKIIRTIILNKKQNLQK